jgi:prepilin-type N-terminal cleavage/methylation domain-containing protein
MKERSRTEFRRRRGFTLIEVVVLMSIVALLMTLGGGVLHRLLAADRQLTRALETARQIDRLSSRLRLDVQQGELDEGATHQLPSRLILRMPDGRTVDYSVTDHRLIREVFAGENRQVRDSFVFPIRTQLGFDVASATAETDSVVGAGGETKAGGRRVRLTLSFSRELAGQPERPRGAPPPRELTIEATLGRLRISEPAAAGGAP